ncbi:formylglycine-generating enzyme family protein [Sphingomonas sp. FW199]|uniref:formylglycine-generating enzyme family protein n=1 Tax=Sphingomonas sp. FW199 TaxID=3400217 RepID=UPI003CEEE1E0
MSAIVPELKGQTFRAGRNSGHSGADPFARAKGTDGLVPTKGIGLFARPRLAANTSLSMVFVWVLAMIYRTLGRVIAAGCFMAALTSSAHSQATANNPGETFRDALSDQSSGPEMVVVPAGRFVMGSPDKEEGRDFSEAPQVEITIAKPFAVGRYELTWDEWERCVAKRGCKDNSRIGFNAQSGAGRSGDAGYGRGRRPVINVSWDDAQAYVAWLSKETGKPYRLLSEAEWEYAARAGSTGRYAWGDEEPTCEPGRSNTANFNGPQSPRLLSGCNGRRTEPVGYSAPNAFGLYDMHGNVREWTQDCFHVYLDGIPTDGSPWMINCDRGGEGNVFRGGSFTGGASQLRSAARQATEAGDINMGFRIARNLD